VAVLIAWNIKPFIDPGTAPYRINEEIVPYSCLFD